MLISSVLSKLSDRLVEYGVVTMHGDFAGENMPPIKLDGLQFWMRENYLGHEDSPLNAQRLKIKHLVVQYELFVPTGSGMTLLDAKTEAFEKAFDLNVPALSDLNGDGFVGRLIKIRVEEDTRLQDWYVRPITLYLSVSSLTENGLVE